MPISGDPYTLYLEDFGAVSGGAGATNRAAIEQAAASGKVVRLRDGASYPIDKACNIVSGAKLVGNGGKNAAEIVLPGDNTFGYPPTRGLQDTNVGFKIWGSLTDINAPRADVHLEGFRFRCQGVDGRLYHAISIRNALRVKLRRMEFGPFDGAAIGIKLDTANAYDFEDLYFHDFYSNSNALVSNGVNLTALWIDDGIVASTPSQSGRVSNMRVDNISVGPTFQAAYGGDQTDGITGGGLNSYFGDLRFSNVGEALDCGFAENCIYEDFVFTKSRLAALKLIYGTRKCQFLNGTIVDPNGSGSPTGVSAIVLAGSGQNISSITDTYGNLFDNIEIVNCGNAGIRFDNAGVRNIRDNRFSNIVINATSATTRPFADSTAAMSGGGSNIVDGLSVLGDTSNTVSIFQTTAGNTWCRFSGTSSWTNGVVTASRVPAFGSVVPQSVEAIGFSGQNKTLTLADGGKVFTCSYNGVVTITVPAGLPVSAANGYKVKFIASMPPSSSTRVALMAGSGVDLYSGGRATQTPTGQPGAITLEWFGADHYLVSGDLP